MSIEPSTTAFDEVVANWGEAVRCEWGADTPGAQCKRVGRWYLNIHGCSTAVLCTHHRNSYIRDCEEVILEPGPYCPWCDRNETAVIGPNGFFTAVVPI